MGGGDSSEFLNMYLDDDYSKMPSAPMTSTPYDFLGAFTTNTTSTSQSSHSNSPTNLFSSASESPVFGIDPALVGTPSSNSSPAHDFDDNDNDNDEDDEEGGEDGDEGDIVHQETIAPVKVGGKGKARKGTVASGGINKKSSALSSTTSAGKENLSGGGAPGKTEDRESDDWRPSPEEYKKMSSKEKRQLRNKISARNFRVRRKGELYFLAPSAGNSPTILSPSLYISTI